MNELVSERASERKSLWSLRPAANKNVGFIDFISALVDWTQMRKYYFTIQFYLDNEETLPEALNAILIVFVVLFIICCCGRWWMAAGAEPNWLTLSYCTYYICWWECGRANIFVACKYGLDGWYGGFVVVDLCMEFMILICGARHVVSQDLFYGLWFFDDIMLRINPITTWNTTSLSIIINLMFLLLAVALEQILLLNSPSL